jgi:Tol biopolymer transport system component
MPLRLSWSHDGKAILLGAADKQNRISYQRLDLNTGQWEEIAPGVGIHGAFSPDDKTLYVSDDFGIVAIELATGQRRLVASVPDGLAGLAVSPDGRTLALVTAGISGGKERLLVVGTGASVEVIESARAELQALSPGRSSTFANTLAAKDPLPRIMSRYPGYRELYVRVGEKQLRDSGGCDCMLAFTRDSSEVLFGSVGSGGLQLMRVPVGGGGKPELTGLVTHGAGHSLDLSPDGTRIAFSDGVPTVSEVWALDNLLPALKATAK